MGGVVRDPKKIDLLYQLRKCLLYLNRSLSAAVACNDRESIREIKKCVDLIKRRIKAVQAE